MDGPFPARRVPPPSDPRALPVHAAAGAGVASPSIALSLHTSPLVALALVAAGSVASAQLPSLLLAPDNEVRYRMELAGPGEVVFDYDEDACVPLHISDIPPRAFRDVTGKVHLYVSHSGVHCESGTFGGGTYRMSGPSFDQLQLGCVPTMFSTFAPLPQSYRSHEWLAALWSPDGVQIHALLHNEYHADCFFPCVTTPAVFCKPRSLTYAFSPDAGASFVRPSGRSWVAPDPLPLPNGNPGISEPSNILFNHRDGYYYAVILISLTRQGEDVGPVSIMRTLDPADPAGWRGWGGLPSEGGSGRFDVTFSDPFTAPAGTDPDDHVPWPIGLPRIGLLHESLTYNTTLDRFVLLGRSASGLTGGVVGLYYSFSNDLIHWTPARLLDPTMQWPVPDGPGQYRITYPALIDHSSPSRNFDVTDHTAHVYFTDRRDDTTLLFPASLDRDLIRFPVKFVAY